MSTDLSNVERVKRAWAALGACAKILGRVEQATGLFRRATSPTDAAAASCRRARAGSPCHPFLKRALNAALLVGFTCMAEDAAQKTGGTNAAAMPATNAPIVKATTNAPAAAETPSGPTALDYSAFRQIADRNIFNASRSSRTARSGGERPRQPQVDTFTVVGTMSYAKGDVAFFDGSSGAYRKAVKLGETIAGHKVTGVTAEEVRLEAGEKKVTLKVGGQMRREDEGPWEMASAGVSRTAVSSPEAGSSAGASDTTDSGASGEVSEVLKRLLQKRQQEEKNENP